MTKTKIEEGVRLITSDIPKNVYEKDIQSKISLIDYKIDWTDEAWMKVVDHVIEAGYDYFPSVKQLKEIYNAIFHRKSRFHSSCKMCFTGLRRYMAVVDVFDFVKKTITKKEMPCAAACSSCSEGLRRHKEEGYLLYNDVISRKDTRRMGYEETENSEEVNEMIRNSKIGMEPKEELPFHIEEKIDDEEELPF